jgi:hypothetical protein
LSTFLFLPQRAQRSKPQPKKNGTTDYADYTDFFLCFFCVFRVFRGSFL